MLRNVARRIRNGAANRLVRPISILGQDFKGQGSNNQTITIDIIHVVVMELFKGHARAWEIIRVTHQSATFGLECEHISLYHLAQGSHTLECNSSLY